MAESVTAPAGSLLQLLRENMELRARLDEIRPLVADLKLACEYDHRDSIGQQVSDRLRHADAVKRLRELVRELEGEG